MRKEKKYKRSTREQKKKSYSTSSDIVPGGKKKLLYIEEKIGIVEKCINELLAMSSDVNEVYSLL